MRRIITFMLCIGLVFVAPAEGLAKAKRKAAPAENEKYASIIIDAETGTVLSEKFANRRLHPASLTKVMTLMLLFEAMENGSVSLSDRITISKHAAAQQPSKLGLNPGATIKVEDAILAVVTKSANDIAVAIGEHLAGSEERFALKMTRRAHDIGMAGTTFRNASGLHNPAQISSARDMATLARYIIYRYPKYYKYFGTKQFTYRGKTMTNHNRLMNTYPGMDGFKTGFINASGFNLIASAKRDGHRLIGVVFGGKSWKSRNDHMASLLDTNFANYSELMLARNGAAPSAAPDAQVVTAAAAPVATAPTMAAPSQEYAAPPIKPILRPTPQDLKAQGRPDQGSPYASLSALDTTQRLVVPPAKQVPPAAKPDATEQAVADIHRAIDRGDYSELTGEGDYDPGATRRVEAGLISAAVYKNDHDRAAIPPAGGDPAQALVQQFASQQNRQAVPPPATAPANTLQVPVALPAASDLWSVQIGAYTSRVATDDALRIAAAKLPGPLAHATPIVVPLKTAEGILFRARLGNFTRDQASAACRYFRDCLPVAPR